MRVLLDHDVPHNLRTQFPDEHEVVTAHYQGGVNYDDDALLSAAEDAFDVLVTLAPISSISGICARMRLGLSLWAFIPSCRVTWGGTSDGLAASSGSRRPNKERSLCAKMRSSLPRSNENGRSPLSITAGVDRIRVYSARSVSRDGGVSGEGHAAGATRRNDAVTAQWSAGGEGAPHSTLWATRSKTSGG